MIAPVWFNTVLRYGRVAIVFHWAIAAAILFMFLLGPYMANLPETDPQQFALFQLHKSIGLTILLLAILRLLWRLINIAPSLPTQMPGWERMVARSAHWALYALMIAIPLFGWATVSSSPLGVPTMWFGWFEWPDFPVLADLPRAEKRVIEAPLMLTHAALAFGMMALVAVHISAALMHHFVNRDRVLKYMLPWSKYDY